MPVICPTITAYSPQEYKQQMEKVAGFAHRIQIDLTDGRFTKEKTVEPEHAWWIAGVKADIHLMYKDPWPAAQIVMEHKPNLIIVHAEAEGNFGPFAELCHSRGVSVGVALLQDTPAQTLLPSLDNIDHVLIFSGNLGYQGGSQANFGLLDKIKALKDRKPSLEIGWDGGINDQNISQLVFGGVDVLNVGGFIQKSPDPAHAYKTLERIAEETGTT